MANHPCVPTEPINPSVCGSIAADWLVSVRNEKELAQVVRFGVDVVDLKEPSRGALAPVDVEFFERAVTLIKEVSTQLGSSATPKLSAALGERDDALAVAARLPKQFSFAKVGPCGCATGEAIRRLWADIASILHRDVELVAVAYADALAARCVAPETVLLAAKRAAMKRCLIDTFSKDGRSTLQHLGLERLAEFDRMAKRRGIWWALAGSVTRHDVAVLAESGIEPNCIAVRGDVCDRDRTGTICDHRLQAWSEMFKHQQRSGV